MPNGEKGLLDAFWEAYGEGEPVKPKLPTPEEPTPYPDLMMAEGISQQQLADASDWLIKARATHNHWILKVKNFFGAGDPDWQKTWTDNYDRLSDVLERLSTDPASVDETEIHRAVTMLREDAALHRLAEERGVYPSPDPWIPQFENLANLLEGLPTQPKISPTEPTTPEVPSEEKKPEDAINLLSTIFKGIEYALLPATYTGMYFRKLFTEPTVPSPPAQLTEYIAKLTPMKSEERWEKVKSDIESILPKGETYKEFRELPLWQQLLFESPFWVATVALPTATALRATLATKAAAPGLPGVLPTAARVALYPIEWGIERPLAVAIKYGIGLPLKYAVAKPLQVGARKSFELALDTGLDKWLIRQGLRGDQASSVVRFFLEKNNRWLYQRAEANWLKRLAEKKGTKYAATKATADTIKQAEPLLLQAAKDAGVVVKPLEVVKPPVAPLVKPPVPAPLARRAEIQKLLLEPVKDLPKGISKIALRKELREINAKLVPEEKALRQKIMAQVKTLGLPQSQYREIFRVSGGSRWLTQVNIERLPRVLEEVRVARPVSIKGKKVITPKIEEDIVTRKGELIDDGILTEETYKDILEELKLSADKYVSKESFITQSEGRSILREMNNRAILAPLGKLKFGKPTPLSLLTSDVYYGQVLGVHPLVEPLELAKVDFDLAYRTMSSAIAKQINVANKAFRVGGAERLRDLLDKFEEAPAELTKQQKAVFNWFRNLNRTIINGENEVRRGLGMPEIAYREAYVRHIPDAMAAEILQGLHPLPPSLEYWSRRIVGKKIFNPMEFHRQLSDDLAKLYTKDLARAARNMVYTGLKEIHLAQPLKAFTERMGALQDVMPASTRKWVIDFVNQRIKGQQTEWDAGLNRLVTESGFGGLINDVLRPYRLSLGTQPVTRLAQAIGKGTILAVLGLPRPRLMRLLIRNLFQRTQELALNSPLAIIKGFVWESGKLKELMGKSRFLTSYTGVEEWPAELMGKLARIPLAPYQATAVINARQAMRTTYHDILSFFTKEKYKDLGWASPKRTYKEPKGFLYPEEETLMLGEMELAARATQYQYIGLGMPGIFRNKTLIPLTRLQSWWMNHFFMFHREAAHRFLYGETRLGHKLPWTKRVNYLTYLLFGGAILTSMGYGMSYLWRVLPHNLSPVGQFMTGLLTYVGADSDWQRDKGKREIFGAWKAMVPGPLAYEEFEKLWSGEMPLWQMFFYGREEEGPPPRAPTWGIINREPAINRKAAIQDIGEAIGLLGQTVPKEMPEPYPYIDEATGEYKLYTYPEEEYVYTTTDLGAAIRRATLKLEDMDITEENGFSPLTLFYKESESLWTRYYYSLPGEGPYRADFFKQPTSESVHTGVALVFWGKLGLGPTSYIGRNPETATQVEQVLRDLMKEYNISDTAIPALEKLLPSKPTPPEASTPEVEGDLLKEFWKTYGE